MVQCPGCVINLCSTFPYQTISDVFKDSYKSTFLPWLSLVVDHILSPYPTHCKLQLSKQVFVFFWRSVKGPLYVIVVSLVPITSIYTSVFRYPLTLDLYVSRQIQRHRQLHQLSGNVWNYIVIPEANILEGQSLESGP